MASSSNYQYSQIKHDVFISFRGLDVRRNFLSHLIKELEQKKIDVYVDKNLERGDEISPSLFRAIEESHISLIIFSRNYASSKWCLEELVKIIECMGTHKQIVIPVFYNTDPSDVREQKGSFGKALAELDKYEESMQVWRSALNIAANLSGFHSSNYWDEVELIEAITKFLSKKLADTIMYSSDSTDSTGFIGINKKIAHLEKLMCHGLDVCVIGIWGMGGVGKTTIATTLFNRFCSNFKKFCFVANIGEESRNGIIDLRNKILSKLLNEHDLHIDTPEGIPTYVKQKLSCVRVLLVLDGVSDSDQVEKLFGSFIWFGSGSRIIITTRDKQVLGKIDHIYEVKPLSFDDAIQLFMSKALDQNYVDKEWIELSRRVTKYARGNPLALKVLGSFLYGKSKEEWKSQLKKLEKMPHRKIYDVLRLSYDCLDDQVKGIFLYLACFLKGYEQCQIVALLDACGFETIIGLKELQDKALITKAKGWSSKMLIVSMHSLIQEMGKEIVRRESMKNPERRSQLWDPDEIYKVLKNDEGTKAIQSISLDNSRRDEELFLKPQVFARMCQLKFLKISHASVSVPEGLQHLPNELRLLHWNRCPLESFPSTFCAENLVILHMTHSNLKKLWDGIMPLGNLKIINFCNSQNLIELPDFSMANNLEDLNLQSCRSLRSLTDLPPSIKQVLATNCSSLETVQFTPGAAEPLNRDVIAIELGNCFKLDEQILNRIGSNVHRNLISYALKQTSPEEHKIEKFDIEPFVVYPGSKVPDWFTHRSLRRFITMAPQSKLQAFIFCVIPGRELLSESSCVKVRCSLDDMDIHNGSAYSTKLIPNNVCLLYHESLCKLINQEIQRCRKLNKTYKPEVFFQFQVTGQRSYQPFGIIKECGVYPIYSSEEMESDSELELGNGTNRGRDITDLESIGVGVHGFKKALSHLKSWMSF